jgi:hypothetical protein
MLSHQAKATTAPRMNASLEDLWRDSDLAHPARCP